MVRALRSRASLRSIAFLANWINGAARGLGGFALAACLVGASGAAHAKESGPEALCEAATMTAEEKHDLPVGLLRAISLVETGRRIRGAREAWPWTINLEGKGHWFDSYPEALAFARKALKQGRTSFDVGCMQINYRWHSKRFDSLEQMFDPRANADYAARYLIELKGETGSWEKASGYYHSRTPKHFKRYRKMVASAHATAKAQIRARRKAVTRPKELDKAFAVALAEPQTAAPTPAPAEAAPAAKAPPPPRIVRRKPVEPEPKTFKLERRVASARPPKAPKPATNRGSWPARDTSTPLIAAAAPPTSREDAWRGLVRLTKAGGSPSTAGALVKPTSARRASKGSIALGVGTRPSDGGLLRPAKPLF